MKYGSITTGIIADGLVFNMDAANRACYPRTGTTTTDTINNLTGTLLGVTFIPSSGSGVWGFDGVDDYINCSNLSATNNLSEITISFWYKFQGTDTENGLVSQNPGFEVQDYANGMYFHIDNTTETVSVQNSAINYKDGNWHNFVFTYKAGSAQLIYFNGSQVATRVPSNTNLQTTSNNLNLGRRNNGFRYAEINMGPVQIYNRALSANEVLHNYNALKGRFGL